MLSLLDLDQDSHDEVFGTNPIVDANVSNRKFTTKSTGDLS